ncbi:alpha/beta fold hydrolase [Muricoccus radiodurans]|uniref:alpha/beta fold hydrolase n=1 Tax=Muricoccus radiodurans TaxID=2231721 RepID=UPI003CF9E18E
MRFHRALATASRRSLLLAAASLPACAAEGRGGRSAPAAGPGAAVPAAAPQGGSGSRYFRTTDGVRLHYLEAGRGQPLVIVPGWSMPAWIFEPQLRGLSSRYRVIVLDPRGQGESEIAPGGYHHVRRGQDIGDLLDHLRLGQAVVMGWSLGVLDTLAYVHEAGDSRIAGLILVDNSIGEDPPPTAAGPRIPGPRLERAEAMRRFVRTMFSTPQPQSYLNRLTEEALRLPPDASRALLSYPVPRTYWREAVYSTNKPVLYAVRPRFEGQAANLQRRHPNAETVIFRDAGHALFVDEPERFNGLVADFIRRRIPT